MRDDELELNPATPDGAEQSGSWTTNGSSPPATAEGTDTTSTESSPDEDGAAFLADLAKAMQTAAGAERIRVSEETDRRRQAHLDGIRGRETAEADHLREVAEDGVKGIDTWADSEIERIQRERERRILSRRRDLEISLEDHRALVAREVDAVEAAIVAYRAEIETYFGRLDVESDPVAIASQAGSRPTFPTLDEIGPNDAPIESPTAVAAASGEAGAEDEPTASSGEGDGPAGATDADEGAAMVAVMDSDQTAVETPADEAQADPLVGATVDAGTSEPAGDPADEQPAETTAQANAVMPRSSAALLQSVPSLRPMASWFRRDGNQARSEDPGHAG
jgi:hypothetical protein